MLDLETTDGVLPARLIASVHTWIEQVTRRLGKVLIYTSPAFWRATPELVQLAAKAGLWLGQWTQTAPPPLSGWPRWTFWQHTNQALVPGLPPSARIDADLFNGTLAELKAYSAAYANALARPNPNTTAVA